MPLLTASLKIICCKELFPKGPFPNLLNSFSVPRIRVSSGDLADRTHCWAPRGRCHRRGDPGLSPEGRVEDRRGGGQGAAG